MANLQNSLALLRRQLAGSGCSQRIFATISQTLGSVPAVQRLGDRLGTGLSDLSSVFGGQIKKSEPACRPKSCPLDAKTAHQHEKHLDLHATSTLAHDIVDSGSKGTRTVRTRERLATRLSSFDFVGYFRHYVLRGADGAGVLCA